MIVSAVSLLVLLVSAAFGARRLVRFAGFSASEPLPAAIAFGTLTVAWCLACATTLAFFADLFEVAIVRIPVIAAVSIGGVMLVAALGRRNRSNQPEPISIASHRFTFWRRLSPTAMVVMVLPIVLLHGFLLFEAFFRPPFAFDGLRYHLPLIVRWIRAGQLVMVPGAWQFCSPSNGELWQMFFASTGIERIIEPSLFPIGLLLAAIVAGIARELGASRTGAFICSLFALACPMIGLQMYSSYVDMFGATFVVGSLYWLLRLVRHTPTGRQRIAYGLLSGLSIGVAIGTKFSFAVWAAVVGICLVIVFLSLWRHDAVSSTPIAHRQRWIWVVAFVLAMPIGSGYWFFRSAYHTGWFLYPMQLRIAGQVVGTGLPADTMVADLKREGWHTLVYPWVEWKRAGYSYTVDNGLGPPFAVFAVIGVAYLLFQRHRWPVPSKRLVRLLVIGFIVVGIILFVEVCFSYARYALPLWALMIAASAPLVDLLLRMRPRSSVVLLSLTLTLSAAMMGLWPAKTLVGRILDGDMSRAYAYQIPALFDTLPPGTVVLDLHTAGTSYPLLGAGWRNHVIENLVAEAWGLQPPLDSTKLEAHKVDIVHMRGQGPPPFTPDVVYDTIYDDTLATHPLSKHPLRIYRVRGGTPMIQD